MTFLAAFAIALTSLVANTEAEVIPLEQVIGFGRGGLRTLEPELHIYRDTPEKIKKYSTPEGIEEMKRLSEKSLVLQIEKAFYELSRKENAKAGRGFAVPGRNRDALPEVHRVAVKGETPRKAIATGKEISLLFFTCPTTPIVSIERIERTGTTVNISYTMYSQRRQLCRSKLLLIPCGKLLPGKYRVKMQRLPATKANGLAGGLPPVQEGLEDRIVCKPFSFIVSKESENVSHGPASERTFE